MARANYGGEKRRKELNRLKKQEEKRLRKQERRNQANNPGSTEPLPSADSSTPAVSVTTEAQ